MRPFILFPTMFGFFSRSLIAFCTSLAAGIIGGIIGASIGGSFQAAELIHIGSRVGYEVTGIIGFLLCYSLWLAAISEWVLFRIRPVTIYVSRFLIVLLETTFCYYAFNTALEALGYSSSFFLLILFTALFFTLALGLIWMWEYFRKSRQSTPS